MFRHASLALLFCLLAPAAHAGFMDEAWASSACDAWNQSDTLTGKLGGEKWAAKNGDRGYKLVQLYRTPCGESTKVQLNIVDQDGAAHCAYGGAPDGKAFNKKYDYVMHATDKHWTCMGAAKFGCKAMGAMMSGKLKFVGPKMEAMGVMGPFNAFLKLVGQVGIDEGGCPLQ